MLPIGSQLAVLLCSSLAAQLWKLSLRASSQVSAVPNCARTQNAKSKVSTQNGAQLPPVRISRAHSLRSLTALHAVKLCSSETQKLCPLPAPIKHLLLSDSPARKTPEKQISSRCIQSPPEHQPPIEHLSLPLPVAAKPSRAEQS